MTVLKTLLLQVIEPFYIEIGPDLEQIEGVFLEWLDWKYRNRVFKSLALWYPGSVKPLTPAMYPQHFSFR